MDQLQVIYDASVEHEWTRLERHRTEFAVTLRAMTKYLPPPRASILDIGGGPGRYSIELAQQGYLVTLFDLSDALLQFARIKASEAGVELEGYVMGTGTDLSQFADNSFDAVLLMGPLYHLREESDRRRAIQEARRVLKPRGPFLASFISRYAMLLYLCKFEPGTIIQELENVHRVIETGLYTAKAGTSWDSHTFCAHPTEVKPLMESEGFESLDLIACEGIANKSEEQINQLSGELWETWADLNYELGRDPSVHGAAEHLLYVGRKK